VDVDDAGTAYVTTVRPTGDFEGDLRLVAVEPGSAQVREVVVFPGVQLSAGLAVSPDGTWGYLTGLTDPQVQGFAGAPVLGADGGTLLVPGWCSDVTTNQEHLYLLTT
jgi:sugar lactone lactonase YvrE